MQRIWLMLLLCCLAGCTKLHVRTMDGTMVDYSAAFRDLKQCHAVIGQATLDIGSSVVSDRLPEIGVLK